MLLSKNGIKPKVYIIYKLIFVISLLIPYLAFGQSEEANIDTSDESAFNKWLKDAYNPKKKIENLTLLEANYGYSNISINNNKITNKLAPVYTTELKYGFIRINEELGVPNRFYLASENIVVSSYAAQFSPADWVKSGVLSDGWTFGLSFKNGYGYELSNKKKLTLYHTGTISWSRIDIEDYTYNQYDSKEFSKWDERYRFGTAFEGGIKYELFSFMHLDLSYNHQIVFPGADFFEWTGSSLLELIAQRGLDFTSQYYLASYPNGIPIFNFIAKNFTSLIFYELRRNNMHWPFNSDIPLNYDTYKIGLTFVL